MHTAWTVAALAMVVAACSGPQAAQPGSESLGANASGSAVALASPGIWEYPASEFPTMCIVFLPNGELQFRGGFQFFNPGRWKRNPQDGTVQMVLGGASPFPFEPPRHAVALPVGTMVKAIPAQRTLVYPLQPDTRSLEFAGFTFYRKAACAAG